MKRRQFTVRIEDHLRARLKELAHQQRISLNRLVETYLEASATIDEQSLTEEKNEQSSTR